MHRSAVVELYNRIGAEYHFAKDRGGSFVSADTTAGGRTVLSVTNTSAVVVRVRIVLGATAL